MSLKIGLIGPGGIAERKLFLPAVQAAESAQLWSVMSRDKSRAAAAAAKYGAGSADAAHDEY